jgi:hypothetical protein
MKGLKITHFAQEERVSRENGVRLVFWRLKQEGRRLVCVPRRVEGLDRDFSHFELLPVLCFLKLEKGAYDVVEFRLCCGPVHYFSTGFLR